MMSFMSRLLGAVVFLLGASEIQAQTIRYVAQAGQTPAAPYASWATAASNIQDAVDAADPGDVILVGDGLYDTGGRLWDGPLTNRVVMDKAVTVRSLNGPDNTVIRGIPSLEKDAVRCVYVGFGAVLDGFTLERGGVVLNSWGPFSSVAGGAFVDTDAVLSNSVIRDCLGGGVTLYEGGKLADSLVVRNQTLIRGGGVYVEGGGEIERCRIMENTAAAYGGGVFLGGGVLRDSFVSGNRATDFLRGSGGGVAVRLGGQVIHCTLAWNTAHASGGGLADFTAAGDVTPCSVVNSVLYHNTAPVGANYDMDASFLTNGITYTCAAPLPPGTGNIADDPMLVGRGNPHLLPASPCRGAGTLAAVLDGETDVDGEPRDWGGAVDMGCDQVVTTNLLDTLGLAIRAPVLTSLRDIPLAFASAVTGRADILAWTVETPTGATHLANATEWTYAWSETGVFAVTLSATNAASSGAVTVSVTIVESFTNFVDPAGGHVAPYTNWAQAATNLQAALAACVEGGVILVQTGRHDLAAEVVVDRGVTIRGVSGAAATVLAGNGEERCLSMSHPDAILEDVTLAGGRAETGGGVWVREGLLRHCTLVDNTASIQGGGAYLEYRGRLEDSLVQDNAAGKWGGGVFLAGGATMTRCVILDNRAENFGGGVYVYRQAEMDNSYVAGNASWSGGGVYMAQGAARNVTVVDNLAEAEGGGVAMYASTVENSVVYHNRAALAERDNLYWVPHDLDSSAVFTCALPRPDGEGNTDADPLLAGVRNPHLLAASPCRGAGRTNHVAAGETDIDGESRLQAGLVDIGCDEYHPGSMTGTILAAIRGDTNTLIGVPEPLTADVVGKVTGLVWRVAAVGGGHTVLTNRIFAAPSWTEPGMYEVVLWAGNESGSAAATVSVHVVAGGFTNYVALTGGHVPPFATWADAATNLQAAVDACYEGGVVLVQTGRYDLAAPVRLDRAVSVRSVSGSPADTILDGGGVSRILEITVENAGLAGFMLTNGYAQGCGGVYMLGGVLSNCVITGCRGVTTVGGIEAHRNAVVRNSVIRGNTAWDWPGGIMLSGNALAWNCLVEGNSAHNQAGGLHFQGGGLAIGCIVQGNLAAKGGGVYFEQGGELRNCLVTSNAATAGAGLYFDGDGVATNSDIVLNWATDGGGVWFSDGGLLANCRVAANHADTFYGSGGGLLFDGSGVARHCVVMSNEAAFGGGAWLQFGGEIRTSLLQANRAHASEGEAAGVGGGFFLYRGGLVADSLVMANAADRDGGAGALNQGGAVAGCTMIGNTAVRTCGGVYQAGEGCLVESSILWSNQAPTNANYVAAAGSVIARTCAVPLPEGERNLAVDPQFRNAAAGDFRLHWDSPCVDAGGGVAAARTTDYDGQPRLAGADEDMGCFELQMREHMAAPSRPRSRAFQANWLPVTGATNYYLDVSAQTNFGVYVPGYHARPVGPLTSCVVTGLVHGARYHVRVRAATAYGVGVNSTVTNALARTLASGNDFTGAGRSQLAVYDPVTGRWYVRDVDGTLVAWAVPWGGDTFVPVPGDYDGDGVSDLCVFDTLAARWYAVTLAEGRWGEVLAFAVPWGWRDAWPVSGDYDGDAAGDFNVTDTAATGLWFMRAVEERLIGWGAAWGGGGFLAPVSGDYNGDGISDLAVFDWLHGAWYVAAWDGGAISGALAWALPWGWPGAWPVSGDFDGDGIHDLAVHDRASGLWYILSVSGTVLLWQEAWGGGGLMPVTGDFDGDGASDLAVYDQSSGAWYIRTLSGTILAWAELWGAPGLVAVGAAR